MGASQAKNFHFPPPWGLPKLGNFHFSPPWGLPKLGNFHFSPPWRLPKLGNFHFFPPVGAPQAREFSLFPPVGASQAREFSLFPAVTASQAMEFSLFPPLEALQAAEFQIARQRRLDSPPNPVFFECVSMFLQWFPSKHGTLHFCRHKTGRKHHVRQCFQFPYLPNRWKYRYLQCFLQFFHVPMPVANSNIYIYKKSFQNIVFDSVFPMFSSQTDGNLHVFCHKGSKSFQNIAFDSVFVMFPVKHTVIYTFFAITSVQNTCFCSVFNALASKKLAKSCYVQCFFSFLAVFSIAGKLPKWPRIPFQYPLALRHPKNPRKMSKTPPYSGLGAKPFLAPPAKADIATAILTNVIEHLVLLFCPPISTPSPPKRCGRILWWLPLARRNSRNIKECLSSKCKP